MTCRLVFIDRDPPSGFMEVDRRCLAADNALVRVVYPGHTTPAFVVRTVAALARADACYAFFASEHALVPALVAKLLRRKLILVPGGYDYANVPERRYGLAARRRRWLPVLLGRLADVALPISDQCAREFLALVPSASGRTRRSYLAVDPMQWTDPGVDRDPNHVITVGFIDEESWSRKGIDRFVATASADPARRYTLGGRLAPSVAARLAREAPGNLDVTGPLSHDELRRLYWSAGVYAQLSWHETFGVSMAEAMLCGCVPLISSSPALHEVAGSWAVDADPGSGDARSGVDAAVSCAGLADRAAMRADIATRFSLAARRAALQEAIDWVMPTCAAS